MRLTDITIRNLKHPDKGQKVYFDSSTPGFGVRTSKRYKSFVVYFGSRENRRFKTLGRYPDLSLQDARKEAKRYLVSQVSSVSAQSQKYADVVSEYLADCKSRNRPKTVTEYIYYLNSFASKKRIGDITRADVKAHLVIY